MNKLKTDVRGDLGGYVAPSEFCALTADKKFEDVVWDRIVKRSVVSKFSIVYTVSVEGDDSAFFGDRGVDHEVVVFRRGVSFLPSLGRPPVEKTALRTAAREQQSAADAYTTLICIGVPTTEELSMTDAEMAHQILHSLQDNGFDPQTGAWITLAVAAALTMSGSTSTRDDFVVMAKQRWDDMVKTNIKAVPEEKGPASDVS